MYKVLVYFKKSDKIVTCDELTKSIIPLIKELDKAGYEWFSVDSDLLMENRYSYVIEVSFVSKDEMDRQFSTPAGKALQRNLMGLQQSIDILFLSKETDERLSD